MGSVDGEARICASFGNAGVEGKPAAPFDGDAGTAPERVACPRPAAAGGTEENDVCSVERAGPLELSGAADKCRGLAEPLAVMGASFLLVTSTATDSAVWKSEGTAPWVAAASTLFKASLCSLLTTPASTGWVDAGLEVTSNLDHEVPPGS